MITGAKNAAAQAVGLEGAAKQFGIALTPETFKFLSDDLYSNKIRAIIREISTNACDAHALVDKGDVPFEVHLPTLIEPFFSVRDFGPGLSSEDVEEIYTVYFSSTKRQSNDFTGCLGLGCKSPFCYNDNFMVYSYQDGIEYQYVMMKSKGYPEVRLVCKNETTEPDGVKVYIEVLAFDIPMFTVEANEVYPYFRVYPNIVNGAALNLKTADKVFRHVYKDLYLMDNYGANGNRVRMGNVVYPVDLAKLDERFSDYLNVSYSGRGKTLPSATRLMFDIPVGAASVTLSRESLSYDDFTLETLGELLWGQFEDYKNHVLAELRDDSKSIQQIALAYKAIPGSSDSKVDLDNHNLVNQSIYFKKLNGLKVRKFYVKDDYSGEKISYKDSGGSICWTWNELLITPEPGKETFVKPTVEQPKLIIVRKFDFNLLNRNRILCLLQSLTDKGIKGFQTFIWDYEEELTPEWFWDNCRIPEGNLIYVDYDGGVFRKGGTKTVRAKEERVLFRMKVDPTLGDPKTLEELAATKNLKFYHSYVPDKIAWPIEEVVNYIPIEKVAYSNDAWVEIPAGEFLAWKLEPTRITVEKLIAILHEIGFDEPIHLVKAENLNTLLERFPKTRNLVDQVWPYLKKIDICWKDFLEHEVAENLMGNLNHNTKELTKQINRDTLQAIISARAEKISQVKRHLPKIFNEFDIVQAVKDLAQPSSILLWAAPLLATHTYYMPRESLHYVKIAMQKVQDLSFEELIDNFVSEEEYIKRMSND